MNGPLGGWHDGFMVLLVVWLRVSHFIRFAHGLERSIIFSLLGRTMTQQDDSASLFDEKEEVPPMLSHKHSSNDVPTGRKDVKPTT